MKVDIGKFESALEIAKRIFEGTRYQATNAEIKKLAENMICLEKGGLGKLNQRLIAGGRKIWDTFAELNFAIKLISHLKDNIPISYEPDEGFPQPIDFKIEFGNITFWIQSKRLALLEKENRQDKIIDQIKREAKKINVGKFFVIKFSENFTEADVAEFLKFLKNSAINSEGGVEYVFPDNKQRRAAVEFWPPKNKLAHLTHYGSTVDIAEITGAADNQIRGSLINAAGAFKWDISQTYINLIVMDADNHRDIHIGNAVFGTELDFCFQGRNGIFWNRENDGLFHECEFSKKVAGVIAMRRKVREPISDCYFLLYMNKAYERCLEAIQKLFPFDKVVNYKMSPAGSSNFKLP